MTTPQSTVTLRGPGDVVAVLPYHLGYHPRDSVVVVSLHERRVGLVLRADLPRGVLESEVVAAVVGPVVREGPGRVVVLGYEDADEASAPMLTAVVQGLESSGVHVAEVIVVRGGRRYSPACPGSCCPREGVPLLDPADVPAVAEYVALGRHPLADRDAVTRLVEGESAGAVGLAQALATTAGAGRARPAAVRGWAALLEVPVAKGDTPSTAVPVEVMAAAAAGLRDIPLRDALIAWLAPGLLPRSRLQPAVVRLLERHLPQWAGMGSWGRGGGEPGEHELLLARLLSLCRSVPDTCPRDAAAVCTVAAHVAWEHGDGALARAAVTRALRLAPDYRLAQLLAGLVDLGVRTSGTVPGAGMGRGSRRAG